jgi:hypothetical protein
LRSTVRPPARGTRPAAPEASAPAANGQRRARPARARHAPAEPKPLQPTGAPTRVYVVPPVAHVPGVLHPAAAAPLEAEHVAGLLVDVALDVGGAVGAEAVRLGGEHDGAGVHVAGGTAALVRVHARGCGGWGWGCAGSGHCLVWLCLAAPSAAWLGYANRGSLATTAGLFQMKPGAAAVPALPRAALRKRPRQGCARTFARTARPPLVARALAALQQKPQNAMRCARGPRRGAARARRALACTHPRCGTERQERAAALWRTCRAGSQRQTH